MLWSLKRVSQGFWGTREHWQNIEGNKGTLANFWEQGNRIRKITVRKCVENKKMCWKCVYENVWEHGNIGQYWKGTREQGPPWETLFEQNPSFRLNKRRWNQTSRKTKWFGFSCEKANSNFCGFDTFVLLSYILAIRSSYLILQFQISVSYKIVR